MSYPTSTVSIPAGTNMSAHAICPTGFAVTGGGVSTDTTDPAVVINFSTWEKTEANSPPDVWAASVANGSASAVMLEVDAICTQPATITQAPTSARETKR